MLRCVADEQGEVADGGVRARRHAREGARRAPRPSTTEGPLAQLEANRQRHRAQAGMLDEAMMYG